MNASDVRTELGSRFDAPTLVAGMPLVLRGRLALAHDFVSNPALGAVFQALPGSSEARVTRRNEADNWPTITR